jgi:cytochrome c oxidase assembly factor CtaG
MRALILIAVATWLVSGRAFAHDLGDPAPRAAWTFDPWIVSPLLGFGALFIAGSLVLRRKRTKPQTRTLQLVLFGAGWISLAGSLVSPLHWLGEHLFTFHMIEHEIIMAVSAPLLVLANPVGPMLWSLPRAIRVTVGRAMCHSVVRFTWRWLSEGSRATIIHGIAIWVWHAPVLFDAAVNHIALHRLQHASFFFSALLFWWSVFRRSEIGAAAWHVFITMLHTSVLGALMALAPRVLYGVQTATSSAWGLTPLEDQQLAGIIMWVPAGSIYAAAALTLMAIWIKQVGARARQGDAANAI